MFLRQFQMESLFYISSMLKIFNKNNEKLKSMILSMPTGGGKTEAFLIPLLNYLLIFKKLAKEKSLQLKPSIKSLILYPTKALSVDQAERFMEILYIINKHLSDDLKISLSVFTGDSPWNFDVPRSFVQVCPDCGNSNLKEENKKIICNECNAVIDFVRIGQDDIVKNPPDILITNPDKINFMLMDASQRILLKDINLMIFDEIHLYEGIFGCHVAHLLRRLEIALNEKPVYIGLSATIKNAKEQAQLLFNLNSNEIKYINYLKHKERYFKKDEIDRVRYHYAIAPAESTAGWFQTKIMTTGVNLVNMLNHSILDPHFRKTVVFHNYRSNADQFTQFLNENESLTVKHFLDNIQDKLKNELELKKPEIQTMKFCGWWINLLDKINNLNTGKLETGFHHGNLGAPLRLRNMTRFISDQPKKLGGDEEIFPLDRIVATKTLELGIDIGDVSTVVNAGAPLSTNEYIQRVGRGGRKKDSLAITILNPRIPLDNHFMKNFSSFINPEETEEVPIIISNEFILRQHIYARILDFIAEEIIHDPSIKPNTPITLPMFKIGGHLSDYVEDNIKVKAEEIYNEMFDEKSFKEWLSIEREVLNYENIDFSPNIKDIFIEGLEIINGAKENDESKEAINKLYSPVAKLIPSLRSTSKGVKIILQDQEEKYITEPISKAVTQLFKDSFYRHGVNTFRVKEVEESIREGLIDIFLDYNEILEYYAQKFSEIPKNPRDFLRKQATRSLIKVPGKIKTNYFPDKFYCPRCHRTYPSYTKTEQLLCRNRDCLKFGQELQQLSQVYICNYIGEETPYYQLNANIEAKNLNDIQELIINYLRKNPSTDFAAKVIQKNLQKDYKAKFNKILRIDDLRAELDKLEIKDYIIKNDKITESCGNIFEPPIPMRCPNMNCRNVQQQIDWMNDKSNSYPTFRGLPRANLKWQCKDCKVYFNFHKYPSDNPILKPSLRYNNFTSKKQKVAAKAWKQPEWGRNIRSKDRALWIYPGGSPCSNPLHSLYNIKPINIPKYFAETEDYLRKHENLIYKPITTIDSKKPKYKSVVINEAYNIDYISL
ncbi:MAG: DEAD/DEAH box helicase, partial [Candidatus Lokiarchaeota archaeon]